MATYKWKSSWEIIYKCRIFHCKVWLPEVMEWWMDVGYGEFIMVYHMYIYIYCYELCDYVLRTELYIWSMYFAMNFYFIYGLYIYYIYNILTIRPLINGLVSGKSTGTPIFHKKIHGSRFRFSLQPILWIHGLWT